MVFAKTEERWPYKNLSFISVCLGKKHRKKLYGAARTLFHMGSSMQSRETVHNSIDSFVEKIGKAAELSDTLKTDLWEALRQVAIDGLELRQDPDLTYEQLEESRNYLDKMCE